MKLSALTIPGLPPEPGSRLDLYARLIRFEKPIGFYLLLWPTLWALAIAADGGSPDGWILFVFVCGVFLMRSAGCAINDYADRDIDLHVARTRERPLTSGKITPGEALAVFAVLGLIALLLVLTLNRFTIQLGRWSESARRELSVHEAIPLPAPGTSGCGLRLGDSDGLRGAYRGGTQAGLAVVCG